MPAAMQDIAVLGGIAVAIVGSFILMKGAEARRLRKKKEIFLEVGEELDLNRLGPMTIDGHSYQEVMRGVVKGMWVIIGLGRGWEVLRIHVIVPGLPEDLYVDRKSVHRDPEEDLPARLFQALPKEVYDEVCDLMTRTISYVANGMVGIRWRNVMTIHKHLVLQEIDLAVRFAWGLKEAYERVTKEAGSSG